MRYFRSCTCVTVVLLILQAVNAQFNPSILQDTRNEPKVDGTFGFLYRTEDGIAHAARGDSNGVIHGRFSYSDPTGFKLNYNYNAGSRSAVPQAPQAPQASQKSQKSQDYGDYDYAEPQPRPQPKPQVKARRPPPPPQRQPQPQPQPQYQQDYDDSQNYPQQNYPQENYPQRRPTKSQYKNDVYEEDLYY